MHGSRRAAAALAVAAVFFLLLGGEGRAPAAGDAADPAQPAGLTPLGLSFARAYPRPLGMSGGWDIPDAVTPDLTELVLEKRAINRQSIGWLRIPGTKIDSVILHDPTVPHNNYFAFYDFYGNYNPNGSFFADLRATFGEGGREDLAKLTALYGHSFDDDPDGELMSSLKRYRDPDFARQHPYFFFSTWKENMVFEVIAVFDAHVNLPYIRYDLDEKEFAEMLRNVFASSLYDYGAALTEKDKLLVVSCCTMNVAGHENLDPLTTDYRFAVMARLMLPGETPRETALFAINESPAPPDRFR